MRLDPARFLDQRMPEADRVSRPAGGGRGSRKCEEEGSAGETGSDHAADEGATGEFRGQYEDDDYEDEDIADADEPASLGTCTVYQEQLNTSKPFGALELMHPRAQAA